MKKIVFASVVFIATGCADLGQKIQQNYEKSRAIQKEYAAKKQQLPELKTKAVFPCNSKESCEKALTVAKSFVREKADMKVQFSDESGLETYNPTDLYRVGMTVARIAEKGGGETIKLAISCPGLEEIYPYNECHEKAIAFYTEFPTYMAERMR